MQNSLLASIGTPQVSLRRSLRLTLSALQAELDSVMGDSVKPTVEHYRKLQYTLRCVNESMRLYPHPPVLLRRALKPDELPGGYSVPKGQDVMISVYNIHRSKAVWDDPDDFRPERFPLDEAVPTELNTGFRCAAVLPLAQHVSRGYDRTRQARRTCLLCEAQWALAGVATT